MQPDVQHCINAVWLLVAIYWVVGAVRAFIGLGLAFITFFMKSAAEERFMREEFSDEYARYSQRVRRLVPFIL